MTALDIDYFIPCVADDLRRAEDRAHAVESSSVDRMERDCTAPEHLHKRSIGPANESDRGTP